MVCQARITLRLSSRRLIEAIAKSLHPELDGQVDAKAHASLKVHGKCLELKFHARDTTSLRAILNSYLRMVSACVRVARVLDELTA
jgi:tRNA threonylcarbamoyladenosine modification (KEOPS) complex  Pcc1 subunit